MSDEHKQRTLEKIAVMQAYVDGKPIDLREFNFVVLGPWSQSTDPTWNWSEYEYRVATTPDSINWDHVSPEWKYMARSKSGYPCLYKDEPHIVDGSFWEGTSGSLSASVLASYVRGTVDWKDSLVRRPS